MLTIINLPPELFAKFCTFLSPADLLSLSQVCRKFRGYLCAPNSSTTQQIWKESRLQFIPKEDMPPPEGMNEEKYVLLLMTERGCQICKKNKECKIYWEFEVRCCKSCFTVNTISKDIIKTKYSQEFLDIIPYRHHVGFFDNEILYWEKQIDLIYSKYCNLPKENLQSWLNDRKHIFNSIMEYSKQRISKDKADTPYVPSLNFWPPISMLEPVELPSLSFIPQFIPIRRNNTSIQSPDEPKRNQFIKSEKKKSTIKFHDNYTSSHMKGKNFKNKFVHRYG
ncbi:unnamed protein product [Rhizophagus irregularis]|uniref:F-box domain-containing protein n=1 Tax=Rhizophagus irregularis TaxID=588596 RepID=A0A2N1ML88_9GLOM|nr:hypothetical protein RhiirC2_855720 [Rhizophagus irregularis]CAB4377935.1 unnamed protein product [Rhizophagus irregularis]CAB5359696.1 unnamed protein product [Rhizophagus irregularis]